MMKSVFVILLCLPSTLLFSQEMPIGTKDFLAPSPEKNTKHSIRNPNASDMIINGILVDKRVLQYYGTEEITGVPSDKLINLNNIYVSSYQLITSKSILTKKCLSFIEKDLNLGDYNHLRLKSQRKEITVNYENCQFKIALFSWDEINNPK